MNTHEEIVSFRVFLEKITASGGQWSAVSPVVATVFKYSFSRKLITIIHTICIFVIIQNGKN